MDDCTINEQWRISNWAPGPTRGSWPTVSNSQTASVHPRPAAPLCKSGPNQPPRSTGAVHASPVRATPGDCQPRPRRIETRRDETSRPEQSRPEQPAWRPQATVQVQGQGQSNLNSNISRCPGQQPVPTPACCSPQQAPRYWHRTAERTSVELGGEQPDETRRERACKSHRAEPSRRRHRQPGPWPFLCPLST